jgi:hypothetical protein
LLVGIGIPYSKAVSASAPALAAEARILALGAQLIAPKVGPELSVVSERLDTSYPSAECWNWCNVRTLT